MAQLLDGFDTRCARHTMHKVVLYLVVKPTKSTNGVIEARVCVMSSATV